MNLLIINAGSSSLKFQLIYAKKNNKKLVPLINGIIDGIARRSCFVRANIGTEEIQYKKRFKNHKKALKEVLDLLIEKNILNTLENIDAIGHRVVHGGEKYRNAIKITKTVKKTIHNLNELAPLHNPPNLEGINACGSLLPNKPNFAVFDTAFHQTLPKKAYKYAIPDEYYNKYGIRRYGFHGISHKYISEKTYELLGSKKGKIIVCHLGNGASISAIKNGECIETSMGFTPLEGIPMGTRSGTIDPAIPMHIMKKSGIGINGLEKLLNNKSGILALSNICSDVREIWAKAQKKDKDAIFTLEYLAYRYALYIGAYTAAMKGLDAISFTAGIGENAWYLRKDTVNYLKYLNLELDTKKNKANQTQIHSRNSKVKVFVIKTNEEIQIAKEIMPLFNNSNTTKN